MSTDFDTARSETVFFIDVFGRVTVVARGGAARRTEGEDLPFELVDVSSGRWFDFVAAMFGNDDSRFNGALTFFVVTFCDVGRSDDADAFPLTRSAIRFNDDDESMDDRDGFSTFTVVVVVIVGAGGSEVFLGIFFCLSNGSDIGGADSRLPLLD